MAANSTSNNEVHQFITPEGTAKYPYLITPDTKFDDRGVFKVDLLLEPSDVAGIKAAATKLAKEFKTNDLKENPKRKGWGLHLPIMEDVTKDGEESGLLAVRFKQVATLRTRDGREIKKSILIFDSAGNRMTDVSPYSGTRMKVSGQMSAYGNPTGRTYGVTFRLVAVQIIQLVEGGGGMTAESLGFEKVDGGFVAPQNEEDSPLPSSANQQASIAETVSGTEEDSEEVAEPIGF